MDAISFKRRFLPYHAKLCRIACRYMDCSEDVEDVVQDLYLKLWQKREKLDTVENDEAFCVTLLKNLCLDCLKQARNRYETTMNRAMRRTGAQTRWRCTMNCSRWPA